MSLTGHAIPTVRCGLQHAMLTARYARRAYALTKTGFEIEMLWENSLT
ncbi:MAG: hypothetical protein HC908_18650 [Calothrix sp. SM1_7_51]|nr:hypothetical protein [Calothrix sp. SM1_7_51]